jgi:hypothetical protein
MFSIFIILLRSKANLFARVPEKFSFTIKVLSAVTWSFRDFSLKFFFFFSQLFCFGVPANFIKSSFSFSVHVLAKKSGKSKKSEKTK